MEEIDKKLTHFELIITRLSSALKPVLNLVGDIEALQLADHVGQPELETLNEWQFSFNIMHDFSDRTPLSV